MTPFPDHQRLRSLFLEACELPAPAQDEFIATHCAEDPALAAELRLLLAHDEEGDADFELQIESTETKDPGLPPRIGRYQVLALLGEGGMGRVYRARQEEPQREVACKLLRLTQLSERSRARFQNEVEILGKLQHPGIAQVIEAGHAEVFGEELPFMAMELVQGSDLIQHAREQGLGTVARIDLFLKVCDAVGHAHEQGVIHRDLKPANILVSGSQPKVLDFGISRVLEDSAPSLTLTGQLVGTVAYMAPEQLGGRAEDLSSRSDVYSLGVVIFELLSGSLPVDPGTRTLAAAIAHLQQAPRRTLGDLVPALRGDLSTVVARALAVDPARRYATPNELAADLRRFLRHEPIEARPATALYQLRCLAQRHRAAVAFALLSILAVLAGLVSSLFYARTASQQSQASARNSYRANIAAAAALLPSDPWLARRHLDECGPGQRGFEWSLFDARLQGVPLVGGDSQVLRTKDGELRAARVEGGRVLVGVPGSDLPWRGVETGLSAAVAPVLSPDGCLVAVCDAESFELRVLSLDGGAHASIEPGPLRRRPGYVISPDGSKLLLFDSGEHLRVYGLPSGALCGELPVASTAAGFSPDGRDICLRDALMFSVYDSETLQLRRSRNAYWAGAGPVFSPDGRRVAVASTRAVVVLEYPGLTPVTELNLQGNTILGLAFDPSGRFLASSDDKAESGSTRIHDLLGLSPARVFFGGMGRWLAFSRDHRRLVSAGPLGLRSLGTGDPRSRELRGHESYVYHCSFSRDGRLLASAGWRQSLCIWDAWSGELLRKIPLGGVSVCAGLAFAADEAALLFCGQPDHQSRRFPIYPGTAARPAAPRAFVEASRGLVSRLASTAFSGHAELSLQAGALQFRVHGQEVRCIYRDRERSLPAEVRVPVALGYHAQRRLLAVGGEEGVVSLVQLSEDFVSAWPVGRVDLQRGAVYCLQFHPGGGRLAVGGTDSSIDLLDTADFSRVASLAGHDSYVHDLAFSPDGTQLVSASGDRSLRIWDSLDPERRRRQLREQREAERRVAGLVRRLRRGQPSAAWPARLRSADLPEEDFQAARRLLIKSQD